MILTLLMLTVKMVRARRVESERSEWLALTAVMTAISAVHWQAVHWQAARARAFTVPTDLSRRLA